MGRNLTIVCFYYYSEPRVFMRLVVGCGYKKAGLLFAERKKHQTITRLLDQTNPRTTTELEKEREELTRKGSVHHCTVLIIAHGFTICTIFSG